jgi:hypothetical protein
MRKLNQKGSFIIWFTLSFALLGTFIGFALDFGRAYLEKARIARLVDGASLAAAKILKGQTAYENDATRAACDSMAMNGAPVVMSSATTCEATQGAPMTALVEFFNAPVPGGPDIKHVRVTGTEPVPTTFLRFLGWMVPGNYSTINVVARAEAGPERPVDLMLVLDRSGSMTAQDGSGQTKINALKTAVNAFLGLQNTFSANDRLGMISFSTRGCGVNGVDTTAPICSPDAALDYATSSNIAGLQGKVNALNAVGGTNTMEALRTARPPLAQAFDDPARATTRKAVLLVTDGQPTFMIRDNDVACKSNPYTNATLPSPGDGNSGGGPFTNGCKHGVSTGGSMLRQSLTGSSFTAIGGSTEYLNTIRCSRSLVNCAGTNGAMYEANRIRNCGYTNSSCGSGGAHDIQVFVIAIGKPEPTNPQGSLDANAKCMLSRIANATDILNAATGVVETMTANCSATFMTNDNDTHADLLEGWPCGGAGPCIDTTQQKGKVYTVDMNGNVNAQLNVVFQEIAQLLKLKLIL